MQSLYVLALLGIGLVVNASPYPQAVTAKIAPSAAAPAGCRPVYPGTFGIAVLPLESPKAKRNAAAPVSQIGDGQIQGPRATTFTMVPVTQIGDGQIQAPTSASRPVVTQIGDGQIQAPTSAPRPVVTQIGDGQIQAPTSASGPVVTQIGDGQIQAPTSAPGPVVTQISDGQIQAPPQTSKSFVTITIQSTTTISRAAVTQINDAQIQAPTTTHIFTSAWTTIMTVPASVASTMSTATLLTPLAGSGGSGSVACKTPGDLELTLNDGVLTDSSGRTGYIASNRQFQFDSPAQAGAIFTSGFSACNNGSLALGGSTVWWQCLSGNFYNLYDRNLGAQCEPISLTIVKLVEC